MSEVNRKRCIQWRYNMNNHAADRYWINVFFSNETYIVISKKTDFMYAKIRIKHSDESVLVNMATT